MLRPFWSQTMLALHPPTDGSLVSPLAVLASRAESQCTTCLDAANWRSWWWNRTASFEKRTAQLRRHCFNLAASITLHFLLAKYCINSANWKVKISARILFQSRPILSALKPSASAFVFRFHSKHGHNVIVFPDAQTSVLFARVR